MKANELYAQLEKDFMTPELHDDWFQYMDEISGFICENFKKRSVGLLCDFADEVTKVYTAVFPSKKVMQKILNDGVENAMLFVHHPSDWDINKTPVFFQMDKDLLQMFKDKKISIFNYHVPLDNYGKYSTSMSLAKALGLVVKKPFAPYGGGVCGLLCDTKFSNVADLKKKFAEVVGHKVGLYKYGSDDIKKGVALVAGGGNDVEILQEVVDAGVNVFVTGVSVNNAFAKEPHEFASKNKINILGGTHYSTEKFACIAMVDYFSGLGLESEFVAGEVCFGDI